MNTVSPVAVSSRLQADAAADELTLTQWMARGGDARIAIDPATGLNQYHSAPWPREVLALASSTANDLSPEALAHLRASFGEAAGWLCAPEAYRDCLHDLRARIHRAYALPAGTDIFFAPSGTDLEYVALFASAGRRTGGIANLLLGADEIGSGCIHSAAGHYFAEKTALGVACQPQASIAGLPPVIMDDLPVRCDASEALASRDLALRMERAVAAAAAAERMALIHVVHGSKTGLVLPQMEELDNLQNRFGHDVQFVVDACQARITSEAIRAYLDRGMIVFVTGSKFMGGPPFSGFALLPPGLVARAAPLPSGAATIFRRAEAPDAWAGREQLCDSGNPGLALRLAAAVFELERFQSLPLGRVHRVIAAFGHATDMLAAQLGAAKVSPRPQAKGGDAHRHPIEMQTLVTLDFSHAGRGPDNPRTFDEATTLHRALVRQGIRLGQPVRCVRLKDGDWGATLRLGLSMPQIVRLDALADSELEHWFGEASERIGSALAQGLALPR